MTAVIRLHLLQLLHGRRLRVLVIFSCVPLLVSVLVAVAGGFGDDLGSALFLFALIPQIFALLLTLFLGGSVAGGHHEADALAYLFTRPLPRWKLVLARWVAVYWIIATALAAVTVICWLVLGAVGGVPLLVGLMVAMLTAVAAYLAMFSAVGTLLPRAAIPLALFYGIIYEVLLSWMPALLRKYSVSWYTRGSMLDVAGIQLPPEFSMGSTGDAHVLLGVTMPLVIAAVSLLVAVRAADRIELATPEVPDA